MPKITYVEHGGSEHVVEVSTGLTVMEGARDNNIPGMLGIIIYLVLMLTVEVRVHAQPVMFTFTLIGLKNYQRANPWKKTCSILLMSRIQ